MFGKQTNFEIAARSPLIVKTPGMPRPGRSARGLVETVDIYPTLAELCGLEPPGDLAGRSFVPMLRDPGNDGKAWAFSFHPRGTLMGRTLRTDRYRIVQWKSRKGETVQVELYDHKTDPDENVNIAARRPEIVAALTAELEKRPAPLSML
jgi:iduronate 2-sulfatase